jgi:hypothetical protein
MGEERSMYRILVGKPEGERPLGRLKYRWLDNIKMGLVEREWGGVAQDRDKWRALVDAVMNFGFHKILGNY